MRRRLVASALAVLLATWSAAAQQEPPRPENASLSLADVPAPPVTPKPMLLVVPPGTRVPLVLHNAVSTRSALPGDPVYLETTFPVLVGGRIAVPAGSYVSGELVAARRAGRVKGRAEIQVRLNTLVLPNGYTVDLNAVPTRADTGANDTVGDEGKIKGDTDRNADVGSVLVYGGAGAGAGSIIGGLAANAGRGAGIGAGAGLVAGLIAVLVTRGPDLELPRGAVVDIQLARPLCLEAAQLDFTNPGQASTLSGPPNRRPLRSTRRVPLPIPY